MKKNISINISGIIFHIDEDGFERLKAYLESINRYFSGFEDSKEIIADIESRIAEIFLTKMTDGQQVVTADDVDVLIATLGTIADFEAIEEDDEQRGSTPAEAVPDAAEEQDQSATGDESEKEEPAEAEADTTRPGTQRVVRDLRRKLLGGVAAGLAYYMRIDPLWIRLLLVLLLLGFTVGTVLGVTIILLYFVAWIILPGSNDLEDDKSVKKLYRDADREVFGGVASGLAAYFNADLALIRVLFVLTAFTSIGVVAYIVLWIITPAAKSITEKMEMKGEPVTLSNIEEKLKDEQSTQAEPKEESIITRIFLAPFRLISAIFIGLGAIFGPILKFGVDLIRILIGAIIVLVGFSLFISFLGSTAVLLGYEEFGQAVQIDNYDYPFEFFVGNISPGVIIAFCLILLIPAFAIMIIGLVVIIQRRLISGSVSWTIFAVWVICVLVVIFSSMDLVRDYKEEGKFTQRERFDLAGETAFLEIFENGPAEFSEAQLYLRGTSDSVFSAEIKKFSRGKNEERADASAASIEYRIRQQDSILIFDSNFTVPDEELFRWQDVKVTLNIPYDKPFMIDADLSRILRISQPTYKLRSNTWVFNRSGLSCLSCGEEPTDAKGYTRSLTGYDEAYTYEPFQVLDINHRFQVDIQQGDGYEVKLKGEDEFTRHVVIDQRGDELRIDYDSPGLNFSKRGFDVKLLITAPELSSIRIDDRCRAYITGFEGAEMKIRLDDRSHATLDGKFDYLDARVDDRSTLRLSGEGGEFEAVVSNRSNLSARDYKSKRANIFANDRSEARVFATEQLTIDSDRNSNIYYDGTDNVNKIGASAREDN